MSKKITCNVFVFALTFGLAVLAYPQTVGFISAHPLQYAPDNSITINGDVTSDSSGWSGADWIPFDTVYDSSGTAIAADIGAGQRVGGKVGEMAASISISPLRLMTRITCFPIVVLCGMARTISRYTSTTLFRGQVQVSRPLGQMPIIWKSGLSNGRWE